jgi:hypothetical protein
MGFGLGQAAVIVVDDNFGNATLDAKWHTGGVQGPVAEAGTLPSADGYVLQMNGTATAINEDVTWANGSVSVYIKHSVNSIMQGVMACAPSNFDATKSGTCYLASYLGSGNYLRLWASNGAAFPGIAINQLDYTLGTPDDQYHKLTLTINRDTTSNPLCVISWDDVPVIQWHENGGYWESTSVVPAGHPGVFTFFSPDGTLTPLDFFSTSYIGPEIIDDRFADPFADSLSLNWEAVYPDRRVFGLQSESATISSNDGKVAYTKSTNAYVVSGTSKFEDVTVSCMIKTTNTADTVQGLFACAGDGNFYEDTAIPYFAASYVYNSGNPILRLWGNNNQTVKTFPGTAVGTDYSVGAADGKYHKLTLVVRHTAPDVLLTLLWDDVVRVRFDMDAGGPNDWWSGLAPSGKVGIFSAFATTTDTFYWDDFKATWDNAPVPPPNSAKSWICFE